MKTPSKLIMTTLALSAMLLPGQALAMDSASSDNVAAANVMAQSTESRLAPAHHTAKPIKALSRKRTIRIVREPLPQHNQAIRTDTHSRFVIATDGSNDSMKVFKAVKQSKTIPNLYKR